MSAFSDRDLWDAMGHPSAIDLPGGRFSAGPYWYRVAEILDASVGEVQRRCAEIHRREPDFFQPGPLSASGRAVAGGNPRCLGDHQLTGYGEIVMALSRCRRAAREETT